MNPSRVTYKHELDLKNRSSKLSERGNVGGHIVERVIGAAPLGPGQPRRSNCGRLGFARPAMDDHAPSNGQGAVDELDQGHPLTESNYRSRRKPRLHSLARG